VDAKDRLSYGTLPTNSNYLAVTVNTRCRLRVLQFDLVGYSIMVASVP
jgi:hypothetical protein